MTDRRTFLTGLALASIAAPAAAQTLVCTASPFAVALAEYRSARAVFDRSMHLPDADACTLAGNASDDAFERMLLAPASSIADIATKLEIALVEYEGCDFDEKRLAIIAKDVRRLAGEA
ncbi:hypothetical protein [Sphingobium sp. YR768]|uniref:hypothetical protein n=1 Tax=Sphingobium sp. YR768 TaxID=1884365 RepID=UPI0008B4DA7C|nr:hypothetical protein [Sphingobium sp. YR768]SEQ47612.1 hypothetical protein SAMN05518866_10155 [Sphingobium sp. YR768]